jgi:hypothetical protein
LAGRPLWVIHDFPENGGRFGHVRYAPKATFGHQNAIGRDGPTTDSCSAAYLFDHLVGSSEQRLRNGQAEHSGGLQGQEGNGGLIVLPNPVADENRELIARTAVRCGLRWAAAVS